MLNKAKHRLIMGQILKDMYSDISIASLIGFKGGTCAHFFYDLPRFSVDLDFDFFSPHEEIKKEVFSRLKTLLRKHGTIKDSHIKRYTIFFFLSYGDTDHNIKVEINTRFFLPDIKKYYDLKEYLGISLLVANKPYLFASKIAALTLRKETAMRDIYDIWYFAKNHWDIDVEILQANTGKTTKKHLSDCITLIKKIKDNEILQGLGELLSEKEKIWIKSYLRSETIFMLRNYISVL